MFHNHSHESLNRDRTFASAIPARKILLFDDDMARRGIKDVRIFWIVALLPLFGSLLYLCLRPSLTETHTK